MNFISVALIVGSTIQLVAAEFSTIERKIIVSDKAPAPLALYSQAVQVDNVLYISGNLGMTRNGDLVDGITNQTKLALDNIGYVLEAAGITFDNVVKVTVFLNDIQDYGTMNEVYGQYFKEKAPARTALMARLPREAKVEIDAIAMVGHIVDVDGDENDAPRIQATLPTVLLTAVAIYQILVA